MRADGAVHHPTYLCQQQGEKRAFPGANPTTDANQLACGESGELQVSLTYKLEMLKDDTNVSREIHTASDVEMDVPQRNSVHVGLGCVTVFCDVLLLCTSFVRFRGGQHRSWPDGCSADDFYGVGGIFGLENGIAFVVHRKKSPEALQACQGGKASESVFAAVKYGHFFDSIVQGYVPTRASAADLTPYGTRQVKTM